MAYIQYTLGVVRFLYLVRGSDISVCLKGHILTNMVATILLLTTYPCTDPYTIWYTIFWEITQGRDLVEISTRVSRFEARTVQNDIKILHNAKTGQKPSRSDGN